MFGRRKMSSNAGRVLVMEGFEPSASRLETCIAGARRAYLSADPLDPTATVDFLLAMDAASNPSVPSKQQCLNTDPAKWDRVVGFDEQARALASCGCVDCRKVLRARRRCPICGVTGRRCGSCRPPGPGWRWETGLGSSRGGRWTRRKLSALCGCPDSIARGPGACECSLPRCSEGHAMSSESTGRYLPCGCPAPRRDLCAGCGAHGPVMPGGLDAQGFCYLCAARRAHCPDCETFVSTGGGEAQRACSGRCKQAPIRRRGWGDLVNVSTALRSLNEIRDEAIRQQEIAETRMKDLLTNHATPLTMISSQEPGGHIA